MRVPRYCLIPDTEIVRALRSNVSALQARLNRTSAYAVRLTDKQTRLNQQRLLDRDYLDGVKRASRALLEAAGDGPPHEGVSVRRGHLHALQAALNAPTPRLHRISRSNHRVAASTCTVCGRPDPVPDSVCPGPPTAQPDPALS